MDRHTDLPLFRWTPPPALIVAFPAAARIGKIRKTADALERSTARGATTYWRRTVADLRRQMTRAHIPADQVEAEIRSFFDAVQADLNRRAYGIRRQPEGGDAA